MSKIDAKDRFYYNTDFLSSPSGRSVRILSEYYGPLQKLQRNKISDTIVFFGSARTPSKEDAEKALKKAPKEIDKQALNQPLIELLDDENKQRYMMIANERKMIYFKGFALGFILSLLALYVLNNNKLFKVTKLTNTCFVLATSFIVNYFFRVLR